MVDLDIIKAAGGTPERLRKVFEKSKETEGKDAEVRKRITDRIRSRVGRGVTNNLVNYRYWYACDLAWDVPFRQTTASLMRGLIDRNLKPEDVLKIMEGHDVSQMIRYRDKAGNVTTSSTGTDCVMEVHAPTFFEIFIPVAKAYTTIRAAAIVNTYRQTPTFKYEPTKSTKTNRLKAEVITDRVQLMSMQYGYYDVIKQAVLHMLHYSQAVVFPMEEWHKETHLAGTSKEPVITKEGIRPHIPHISRTFFDPVHRPSTINCDVGVSFGGYWRITNWGEIRDTPGYWNLDEVSLGQTDYIVTNPAFFNTIYSSCALRFPQPDTSDDRDRESKIDNYTDEMADKAILRTEYFEKMNPKKEGLFDYDHPLWFRFAIASDDTILYCAPLPYNPMSYFGYDALETRSQNASLTLECLPTQDHISNLISQYLVTIKQNLANLTLFDTNVVDREVVAKVQNLGEEMYRGLNFVPTDNQQNLRGQNDVRQAFTSFTFPKQPAGDLINGINQLLSMLERLLQLSPQELAQSASHEQTAEEIRTVTEARSTRFEFTAGAVDMGIYAFKKMLYDALMAYGTKEVYASLPIPVDEKALEALGFTVVEEESDTQRKVIKGNITAVSLDSFSSARDGDQRINNAATASAMTTMLSIILGNQAIFADVGAAKVIDFMNQIAATAGLPRDFRFVSSGMADAMMQRQVLTDQLAQMQQEIAAGAAQMATQQIVKELAPLAGAVRENREEIEKIQEQVAGIAEVVLPAPPPLPLNDPSYQESAAPVGNPGGPQMAEPAGGPAVPQGFGI